MTGRDAPSTDGAPSGPPWPLELLAELHAGAFDEQTTARLRTEVDDDPAASATLTALDATIDALQAFAELPSPRMPEDIAARIDAAIADEVVARSLDTPTVTGTSQTEPIPTATVGPAGRADVIDFAAARQRRARRGMLAGVGILTAAAAAVGVLVVGNLTDSGQTSGTPNAQPGDTGMPPMTVSEDNLAAAIGDTMGANDYGPLAGPGRLDACLAANGVDTGATTPVGAREVDLNGRAGVLIVLPAGSNPPQWRLLVVGPDCAQDDPDTLADTTTG